MYLVNLISIICTLFLFISIYLTRHGRYSYALFGHVLLFQLRKQTQFFFSFNDSDENGEPPLKWHVYVTGHSLGGALATLLALELLSSQLAK